MSTAESEVDELEQAVTDDREAIEVLTSTANETIILAEDILQRITIVNVSALRSWLQCSLIPSPGPVELHPLYCGHSLQSLWARLSL